MDKSKKIIFIASYPKSGNTWLRSIISSLVYSPEGRFTFNDLKKVFDPNKVYGNKPNPTKL